MKKQLLIIGIIVLLVCVELSGCTNNPLDTERNKFIGTWKGSAIISGISYDASLTCLSDGTFSIGFTILGVPSPGSGTWEIKDNTFVLNGQGGMMTFSYVFSNSDKSLTLTSTTSPMQLVMTKQ